MVRGTTVPHTFKMPFDTSLLTKIRIVYSQNGTVIIEKQETDVTLNGRKILVELSQEETLKFAANLEYELECKVKTSDGQVHSTGLIHRRVYETMCEEVL